MWNKYQKSKLSKFCKKHHIVAFGGTSYGKPNIYLDLYDKSSWITQRSVTGHNIGVHRSVENDKEVISGWCGMGWVLFGRTFVEKLTKEFRDLFPQIKFAEYTECYDTLPYKKNYVKVYETAEIAKKHDNYYEQINSKT